MSTVSCIFPYCSLPYAKFAIINHFSVSHLPSVWLVIVKAHDLLVLSDVDFISTVVNYLRAIFDPKVNQASHEVVEESVTELISMDDLLVQETIRMVPEISDSSSLESTLTASSALEEKSVSKRPLLLIKFEVSITNFRVAIIEDVYTENPQALTLRVGAFFFTFSLLPITVAYCSLHRGGLWPVEI